MTTQTIEVEGLLKGWRAVAYIDNRKEVNSIYVAVILYIVKLVIILIVVDY